MNRKMLKDFLDMVKPRIVSMVLVTTAIGFFMGGKGITSWELFIMTLLGTAFSSGGAAVLNNYIERDIDTRMDRTCNRALPAGRVLPVTAFVYGVSLVLIGAVILFSFVNLLTAYLNLLAAFLYVIVYTPLKRISWWNTFVGAIPGAIPPVAGWTAATGQIGLGSLLLFAVLFTWQHPHFYAIAWMYKDDYRKGGFKMLPVVDESGKRTITQIIGYSLLLIVSSVSIYAMQMAGHFYLVGTLLIGFLFLAAALLLAKSHEHADARRLLRASIIYLPLLLVLIVLDSRF